MEMDVVGDNETITEPTAVSASMVYLLWFYVMEFRWKCYCDRFRRNSSRIIHTWSDGQTTATATGLAAGSYTVTVKDDNNCQAIAGPVTIQNLRLYLLQWVCQQWFYVMEVQMEALL